MAARDLFERFDSDRDGNLSTAERQAAFEEGAALPSTHKDHNGNGLLTKAELAGWPEPPRTPWTPVRFSRDFQSGMEFYIGGLFEYLRSLPKSSFVGNLRAVIPQLDHEFSLDDPENLSEEADRVASFLLHEAEELWVAGLWWRKNNMPLHGEPQRCQFLVDVRVKLMLGIDLCNPEGVASLRTVCPASCLCQGGQDECPASCPSLRDLVGAGGP